MQEYIDFINNYKSSCDATTVEIQQGRYAAVMTDAGFTITVDTELVALGVVPIFKYVKNQEPIFLVEAEKIEGILKGMRNKIASQIVEYSRIRRNRRSDYGSDQAYVKYLEKHLDFLLEPTGSKPLSGVSSWICIYRFS